MIVLLIIIAIFSLMNFLLSFLPVLSDLPLWGNSAMRLLSYGLMFFPSDVWVVVITNITFWIGIQISWSIIEWVYRKIPGVN